jgi:tRNA-specific adenosine deaminase 1
VWKTVAEIAGVVGLPLLMEAVRKQKYRDVKGSEALASRRLVKEDVRGVLKGWVRNDGDDEFGIDVEAVR